MMNYKGGVRVTMVSGDRALLDHEKRERDMREISAMLSAKEDELPEAVRRLMEENEDRKCQIIELQKRMNELKVQQIPEDSRYQCLFETNLNQNGMRDLMNKVLERGVPICGVFLKRGRAVPVCDREPGSGHPGTGEEAQCEIPWTGRR